VPGVVYRDYRLALGGELFEHAADLLLAVAASRP
jgi:hypothetical protein